MDAKLQILTETFENEFSMHMFTRFTREFFNTIEIVNPDKKNINYLSEYAFYIASHTHVANYTDSERNRIAIFSVELKSGRSIERARSMQRNFISKLISNSGHDAAIVAFYNEGEPRWRLSLVRLDYEFADGRAKMSITPAKRYSYLVGKGEPCHTAMEQLFPIFRDEQYNPSLDKIEEAFSIETVTKEFFGKYKEKYFELREYLDSNRQFNEEAQQHQFTSEQFAKKLMGQLAFLYFLQKKGWLGVKVLPHNINEKKYKKAFYSSNRVAREIVPMAYIQTGTDEYRLNASFLFQLSDTEADVLAGCFKSDPWGSGTKTFIRDLYDVCLRSEEKNYFDDYLEPLFYEALNRKRGVNHFYKKFNCKIPFLNGGLFEPLENYDWEHTKFGIPNDFFSNRHIKGYRDADGILDIFDRYNFTMNEDEPLEREVAVDPEMLGKIFENLLDADDRKSKGAFYTPREIVHYMCQESLTNYLVRETGVPYEDMKEFILYGELMKDEDCSKEVSQHKQERRIPESVYIRLREIDEAMENVKVADPSVGSGAFPLGMLSEIVRARGNITEYFVHQIPSDKKFDRKLMYQNRDPYRMKWDTIKNCIFAVDIEASAVDIAKLRLWLSLVVDQEVSSDNDDPFFANENKDPHPLPNLDYNIMCGNSLVDEFEGVQLFDDSLLTKKEHDTTAVTGGWQISLFSDTVGRMTEDLFKEQDRLFGEEDTERKSEIKKKIDKIIEDIIRAKLTRDENTEGLAKYDESLKQKTKPYFLWKLEFARIFKEGGGFDIVIGNPPYLGERKNKQVFTAVQKSSLKKYYLGRMDYFYFFFHLGLDLLKDTGVCSYITTNYFTTALGARTLRTDLKSRSSIIELINFNEGKVFNSAAGQHNMITTLVKGNDLNSVKVVISAKVGVLTNKEIDMILRGKDDTVQFAKIEQEDLWDGEENYLRLTGIQNINVPVNSVLDKIKIGGTDLLGNICTPLIGLESSLDDVYVLSKEKVDSIVRNNSDELKQFKPFYKNSDVDRYYVNKKSTKYILYLHEKIIDIESFKGIYSYLLEHENLIKNRKGANLRGAFRRGNWWVLNTPRLDMDFADEKIVTPYRTKYLKFALSTDEWYASRDVYYIVKNKKNISLKYILALLNSKLYYLWFYHRGKRKGDTLELYAKPLKEVPIKEIPETEQQPFIDIVNEIIHKKKDEQNTTELERKIDFMVYELYRLTPEEIKLVEG